MLGRLIKVTPSSKVVGDLALALVGRGITASEFAADPSSYDIPDSVIGFLRGELGDPAGGWPEPLRTIALEGARRGAGDPRTVRGGPAALDVSGRGRRKPSTGCCSPARQGNSRDHQEQFGDTSGCRPTSSSTGCATARSTASNSNPATN